MLTLFCLDQGSNVLAAHSSHLCCLSAVMIARQTYQLWMHNELFLFPLEPGFHYPCKQFLWLYYGFIVEEKSHLHLRKSSHVLGCILLLHCGHVRSNLKLCFKIQWAVCILTSSDRFVHLDINIRVEPKYVEYSTQSIDSKRVWQCMLSKTITFKNKLNNFIEYFVLYKMCIVKRVIIISPVLSHCIMGYMPR